MHLSMVPKARDEMQRIHWNFKNHFVSETKNSLNIFTAYDPYRDENFTRQKSFQFSDKDRLRTEMNLREEIPRSLTYNFISAEDYFLSQINDSVATKEMIYREIENLSKEGEIEIRTKNGNEKRSINLKDQDIIRIPNQFTFTFKD